MRRRGQSGSVMVEVAMWIPIMLLLITGAFQFGRITYIYYTIRKTVNTVADYLATQNGVTISAMPGNARRGSAAQRVDSAATMPIIAAVDTIPSGGRWTSTHGAQPPQNTMPLKNPATSSVSNAYFDGDVDTDQPDWPASGSAGDVDLSFGVYSNGELTETSITTPGFHRTTTFW